MCFSKEVSLATFLTGIFGGILCISTGVPDYQIIGLFFIFISLMQGIEYLLWSHQKCDNYNIFLTYLGLILNHLQPVILFILLYMYSKDKFNKYKKIIVSILVIYIITIVLYSLQFKSQCTLKDQENHLYWKYHD